MIIFWDHDGTIVATRNPNDYRGEERQVLPGVEALMRGAEKNIIISGFKSAESEAQDFDPEKVIINFQTLMSKLPIDIAIFSPARGGIACYVVIKDGDRCNIIKAHENAKYKTYIGKFKKPAIGMFIVARDLLIDTLGHQVSNSEMMMIGDSWHDQVAAQNFGIRFIPAEIVHKGSFIVE